MRVCPRRPAYIGLPADSCKFGAGRVIEVLANPADADSTASTAGRFPGETRPEPDFLPVQAGFIQPLLVVGDVFMLGIDDKIRSRSELVIESRRCNVLGSIEKPCPLAIVVVFKVASAQA